MTLYAKDLSKKILMSKGNRVDDYTVGPATDGLIYYVYWKKLLAGMKFYIVMYITIPD